MKIKIISFGFLLNLLLANVVSAFEAPSMEVTCTNLTTFPFLKMGSSINGRGQAWFTVKILPSDGHVPRRFHALLRVEDSKGLVVQTELLPKHLPDNSAVLGFLISTNYLPHSNLELAEPHSDSPLDDNPTTYSLKLGTLIDAK